MGTITITDLLGAYDSDELGVQRDGNGDAGAQINAAFSVIANAGTPNGRLYLRPGTYNIVTSVVQPSNVEVFGSGSSATVIRLAANAYVDVWTATSVSNIGLRGVKLSGNRSNNALGTRNALWLQSVTDALIEDVELVSARTDGAWIHDCTRLRLRGMRASDNGRHGIAVSYSTFNEIDVRSYDNSKVSSVGTGDGVHFELLAGDNTLLAPICYETALNGDRQGYGVREAIGEGCYRNSIFGGSQQGNKLGGIYLESKDSIALSTGLVSIGY